MKELIYGITTLNCDVIKTNPLRLEVTASGLTRTGGWTCPALIPLFKQGVTPVGGNYKFEFRAMPPTVPAPDVLTPISVSYLFTSIPPGIKKVTVIAEINSMEEELDMKQRSSDAIALQDLLEFTGVSNSGSFEEALSNARKGLERLHGGLYVRGEVVSVQFVLGGTVGENTVSVTVRGY